MQQPLIVRIQGVKANKFFLVLNNSILAHFHLDSSNYRSDGKCVD